MTPDVEPFQRRVNRRQQELHDVAQILATSAQRMRRWSAVSKVLIVVLGAVAATSGAAVKLAGAESGVVVATYAVVGLAITTVGGLEASFKLSERSAELIQLAATCQSALREIDSRWQKDVGPVVGEPRVEAIRELLDHQDATLTEVQERAARLGINIALEVRELVSDPARVYPA